MLLRTTSIALSSALLLSSCAREPDPALQAEKQRLEQTQAALAEQLRKANETNAALANRLDQVQQDLASIKAAPAVPAAAPVAETPAAVAPPPADPVTTTTPETTGETLIGTAQGTPTTTLKPSGADESKTLQPGWIVEVFPMKFDPNGNTRRSFVENNTEWRNFLPPEEFSLGSFVNAPSPIRLLAHRKFIKGENHVQYVASGYFTVQNRGDHVFVLTLTDKKREGDKVSAVCNIKFALEGQETVNDYIRIWPGKEFSANGGANLIEGLYKSQLALTCNYVGPQESRPDLGDLQEVSLTIAVRRPGEPAPVEMTDRDVVYVSQK